MPELPEVETTRRKIEPLLRGRVIASVEHDAPHKYRDTHLAVGRRVQGLSRRGKYLMLQLASADAAEDDLHDLEFIVHLGMTGGFRLDSGPHTRVTLTLEPDGAGDSQQLFFHDPRRFGKMAVVRPGEYAGMPTLAAMGPEPLSEDFIEGDFVRLAREAGAVKPWLLSQKPVSGVGNIYADESLWQAQIHPAQTRLTAAEGQRLYTAIREVMAQAVDAGGSSLGNGVGNYRQHDGLSGLFQHEHHVYGRAGQPCPRCGTDIVKTVLAQRGTHFCPKCQVFEERPRS
ncbi:DNA-formamidopyrimidine glycosylase [Deinococcus humi]|uniref:Formamidopyrimidine-DNA glycosylase n=1 Tax=Deinococcus humi TaxID=662880 RepID=A0A7W8JQ32_9DEIO|nr:DNA-formamidopyrimidine glycosylase [Deinococcus humi]MBB5361131.1 formamidopyrimidine-DNA glycosylase [Deinococcus humi]GGO18562.1 formamidopyrimidine-DNA glycosylase [Deinococcus humi]